MTFTSAERGPIGHVAVVIPTYNELANLEDIVTRARTAVPAADILVVDDNSPDGTGELADKLAADDDHIRVLHRAGKGGLGAAYVAGFGWALERGYGTLVEMDADGSHDPADLPRLLAALEDADLVVGSRWVPGGVVVNWPRSREILSRGGNAYTRLMLGIGVHDATGGYRAYRAATLRAINLPAGPVPGLLLPDRPDAADGQGGLPGTRGADHVHRADPRREQDEPRHRGRGAVAGDPVGPAPATGSQAP